MNDSHVTVLWDGRDLGWLELGDPSGMPVFAFHGTPGSRLQCAIAEDQIVSAGVRLVCPDRPGYGLSSFQPGRRLVDWPRDVAELADHLGIDQFAAMGVSGGGPHAAACAALLDSRVTTAAIVSGVGPLWGVAATEGMLPMSRVFTKLSRRGSLLMRPVLGLQVALTRRWPNQAVEFIERQLPPPDVAILQRPEVRTLFEFEGVRTSRTAGKAAVQELEIFCRDWGFALADISIPVHLWQGDADMNVPASHARLQHEAIAGSVLHECPGEGHFLIFDRIEEILEVLTTPAAA
jgi:pimeloyl-ACP methyl ester carboxylesterase